MVKYQMAMKEDQFTHLKTFNIFIGTWNVNGQAPPTGPVHEWLACDEEPPDVYAIGFQVKEMIQFLSKKCNTGIVNNMSAGSADFFSV